MGKTCISWIKGKSNGLNQENLQLSISFYNFDLKQGVAAAGAGAVQQTFVHVMNYGVMSHFQLLVFIIKLLNHVYFTCRYEYANETYAPL